MFKNLLIYFENSGGLRDIILALVILMLMPISLAIAIWFIRKIGKPKAKQ